MLVGVLAIVLNIILASVKLVCGIVTASVSIISDGVNNLMDAGSSVITTASFSLSGKKADKEHPNGHGRYEYIAEFIIGIIILFVGVEVLQSSIGNIIAPVVVSFSGIVCALLLVSVAVKICMGVVQLVVSGRIKSAVLKASALDSFSDAVITAIVVMAFFIGDRVGFGADAYVSAGVSVVIIISGLRVLKTTISKLLGNKVDSTIINGINEIMSASDKILGFHDLNIHEYGPDKIFATIHVDIDGKYSMMDAHQIIDDLEKSVKEKYAVSLVVHCDPVDSNDKHTVKMIKVLSSVTDIYDDCTLHDVVLGADKTAVSCHIKLPEKYEQMTDIIKEQLTKVAKKDTDIKAVEIEIEIIYA